MDMRTVLSRPNALRSVELPLLKPRVLGAGSLRAALEALRGTLRDITRPVSDEERFFHRELVTRDVDGKPAHDMPLTTPGPACTVFSGDIGPAHYHFGRRSNDGARLLAFAGTACPASAATRADAAAPDLLRVAS